MGVEDFVMTFKCTLRWVVKEHWLEVIPRIAKSYPFFFTSFLLLPLFFFLLFSFLYFSWLLFSFLSSFYFYLFSLFHIPNRHASLDQSNSYRVASPCED